MGAQQPYMYDAVGADSRLPEKGFDPKAVTRASWEVKPKKPKKKGPLVSFNRHPDAQAVPTGRTYNFRPMSDITKSLIKWMRYLQLVLRAFELVAGAGLLTLMILISNVPALVAWILRIAPSVIVVCSTYAIYHLARPARARPPASSAAYQLFAGITDLAILPFYAFGTITVMNESSSWETILDDKALLPALIEAEHYALLTGIGLHALSLSISVYLGLMFKRIANMPPDMNPLESNLTSRAHKRNKSSVGSSYTTLSENSKRLSTPLEGHRRSGAPYEDLSRPPSIPFMHTRSNSQDSLASSSKRDSRVDLPSRQYQITPGNSPRNSGSAAAAVSSADQKRKSNPRLAQRGSYVEIPFPSPSSPAPSSPERDSHRAGRPAAANPSPTRVGKFTEAWYASESLINRTQQRQRVINASERAAAERSKAYEALSRRYDDSDSERENAMRPNAADEDDDISELEDDDYDGPINVMKSMTPDPLRMNPQPSKKKTTTTTPFAEMSANRRSVSGSRDVVDAAPGPGPARRPTILGAWRRSQAGGGNRSSSIQPDDQFYSKPYGELKSSTPPIMYGGERREADGGGGGGGRQVSSGNDYDLGSAANAGYRRKISGRAAEEGMAGPTSRYSRYSVVNE
ncbi:hypothetical protein SAMD00023353_0801850 [Rosellinia necatrix]|uniref:Uncharacterized protein n=1 Tax=Rosellinia necatrix TaxID=77044 RepID=A0A1W2TB55_ROSNE|nr:hypothetical protein SAMD00023353_0801850 [Rosellinia necatrix]